MFKRLNEAWSRNRSSDESDANGLERFWRQGLRSVACPETVTIAGYGHKARNASVANDVVDLASLRVRAAEVSTAKSGITGSRPRRSKR
jgi:hypothetical protein